MCARGTEGRPKQEKDYVLYHAFQWRGIIPFKNLLWLCKGTTVCDPSFPPMAVECPVEWKRVPVAPRKPPPGIGGLNLAAWQSKEEARLADAKTRDSLMSLINVLARYELQPQENLNSRNGNCWFIAVASQLATLENWSAKVTEACKYELAKALRKQACDELEANPSTYKPFFLHACFKR